MFLFFIHFALIVEALFVGGFGLEAIGGSGICGHGHAGRGDWENLHENFTGASPSPLPRPVIR